MSATITRESYYAALFAKLVTIPGIVTSGRRMKLIDEMSQSELPALFMVIDKQETTTVRGLPSRHVLSASVFVYAAAPDHHTPAGPVLNGLIDAVDAALAPDFEGFQTLGGTCSHCWIDGTTEVFDMGLGEKAVAIIPVQILVP